MIGLLLATQLLAAAPAVPPQAPAAPPGRSDQQILHPLPARQACAGAPPGHVEVALPATPSALYRDGDRPVKGLRKWADYPDGVVCAVEAEAENGEAAK